MHDLYKHYELTDLVKQILELNTNGISCAACNGRRVERRAVFGVPLALLQAHQGERKVLRLSDHCPHCDGTGEEWDPERRVAMIARELAAPRRFLVYE